MRGSWTVLSLAVRLNRAHRSKFVLLALLVALGMTVFLIVTELSRVSSAGLDDAIAEDAGETGTYVVEVNGALGLTIPELAAEVGAALHPFASRPPEMVEILPQAGVDCPPDRRLGPRHILVLRDGTGEPVALPFGREPPSGGQFCIEGQQIPASALYFPTAAQQRSLGDGVFIDSAYRQLVVSATTQPVHYRFVVATLRQADEREPITRAVSARLVDDAHRHGKPTEFVSVSRVDSGGSIRSAGQGIRLVYSIIAWGVLVLGGLGLLIAELIVVHDRGRFFGLARAVGARRGHIAALVVIDIFLVLLAGTVLAMLIATAAGPVADSFAVSAFGLHVQLLRASTVPLLAAGGLLVLLLAGVYPAVKATRQDPLDVLEPKAP